MVRTFINGKPSEIQGGAIDRNWFDKVHEETTKIATLEEENKWLIAIIQKLSGLDNEEYKNLLVGLALPEHIKKKLNFAPPSETKSVENEISQSEVSQKKTTIRK